MDGTTALRERTELFDNVYNFKHNKRVPVSGNFWTWKFFDAGYKLDEVLYDYDRLEKAVYDFHERYQFDSYLDVGTRNSMRVSRAIGGGFHKIAMGGEMLEVQDHHVMERDEYGEYMRDPAAFYWSKVLMRTCKPGITLGELREAVLEFIKFREVGAKIREQYQKGYGALLCMNAMIGPQLETFFNTLRGIKELSMDLRRCKDELKEALDVAFKTNIEPRIETMLQADRTGYVADIGCGFLAHSVLSVKQFEELYWPYFKKVVDIAVANDKRIFIFCESTMLRFYEFFQDIPKGVLLIHLEQDDIFEIRRLLPNIALAGGMPAGLLGNGTPQECVDYAKKLIDTLGEGYVLSQDKMMSYRNDAKRENLLAVNEFVRNYQY